jgi:hypothetical protein
LNFSVYFPKPFLDRVCTWTPDKSRAVTGLVSFLDHFMKEFVPDKTEKLTKFNAVRALLVSLEKNLVKMEFI